MSVNATATVKKENNWRQLYIVLMSAVGATLLVAGLSQAVVFDSMPIFLLLIVLGILAQIASTSAEITYEVGSAVALAATPFYGPLGAAVVVIFAHAGFWLINNYQNFPGWKHSLEQLGFNSGMHGLSLFLAGTTLVGLTAALGNDSLWLGAVAWLLAAVVADQVNIWLLIVMIYLQHGVSPREVWWANRWAMPINVIITAVGGGVLAMAIAGFGLLGPSVFFLPIFLSAYAFRLYVSRTQEQMDRLEDLVELRTRDLAEANDELEQLNEQKDAFLAVLTHDMRTPLTNIHGYASLLRDHPQLPEEQRRQMANVILRNERALLEIVNNILDIEHLESGATVMLEGENFNLVDLVEEIIESNAASALDKRINLTYKAEPAAIFIHADRAKMGRVLQNLVSNAIKYTQHDGAVCVHAASADGAVKVTVEDNGYGIPAGALPHIFDRYSRVDKHENKAVGTGLGLAIVKNLVEAHNGEITVESEEDVGSVFTVRLPA
ncbi:MAG: HAMP domain-containing sensor histidine kinase [Candidatus Promineifilaceae bacterium]|nr:HAMP domain-containing sensor histidine kinase [Candidatus Promineifilaceae bacterium]